MNEMAEGRDACDGQQRSLPASSSPLPSHCGSSFQTWLPVASHLQSPWMTDYQEQDSQDRLVGTQSNELPLSGFYEELFCTGQSSTPLVPLVGSLITTTEPQSDAVKQGYLGKLERNQTRYFVLRAGSHTRPSRLEWYKNQEKFTAMEKSPGKAAPFGQNKQGVIFLSCCLGVNRTGSSRKGHTVALYTKAQTMVLVMEDQQEQDEWYLAIRKLMEEERKDEEHEDEDDGYCTLPPAAFFKEVWPVTVKPRGLGRSKSLAGETRLCLTASSLTLVRVSVCNDLPSVTIPLLSIRRFGHLDGSFFMELGRSAPTGPGEIWMEARDQGNPAAAQNIHEVIIGTVRALRALPDFSRSPTSSNSQPQALLVSKRSRPKYRDKLGVRPLGSVLTLPPNNSDTQSSPGQCYLEPHNPDKTHPESARSHLSPVRSLQSSTSETDSYMEMKTEHCSVACWEQGEEEERRGYMIMSPQVSPTPPALPQDDYVTMASPHKQDRTAFSSPSFSHHASFSSSASDSCSPLHPSHHQTSEHHLPHWLMASVRQWETEKNQSQTSISCSSRLQDAAAREQKSAQRRQPAQTWTTSSAVGSVDVCASGLMAPFDMSGPVYTIPSTKPSQAGSHQSSQPRTVPLRSVRHRLSSCLPSCLQAEDRS